MKMKDSGVEWIGAIPEGWEVPKLLNCLRTKISDGPHETPNYIDKGIPFISVDSLNDSEYVDLSIVNRFISEEDYIEYSKKAKLEENDILFSKAATIGKTAIVHKDEKFMIWSPIAIVKANERIDNRFLYFLLNYEGLITYISNLGSVNTQINVGMKELEQAKIPLPPKETQQKIATYLDEKCSQIEKTIQNQQQVIEKLKAYKQSLITEAVTGKVKIQNGKVVGKYEQYKDSGVEWIGEIPSGWTRTNFSRIILDTRNGISRRDLNVSEGNVVLKLKNITSEGNISTEELNRILLTKEEIENYSLKEGDFLFVRVNGSRNLVGKCAIYHNIEPIVGFNDHIIRVRFNLNVSDVSFLKYYLLCSLAKYDISNHIKTSAGQFTISSEDLRDMQVLLPPKEEQKTIAEYLDKTCATIDSAIEQKQKLIEKLTEYKKSLIYECVTGKRKVSE